MEAFVRYVPRVRILVHGINFAPEPTGIGKYAGEMAEALCSAGHAVRVVAAPPYYPQWKIREGYRRPWYNKESSSPDLTVFRCPLWVPARPTGLKRLLHLVSFAISSFPIVLWQRTWRPDVIIVVVPTLFCVPAALLAAWGTRAKTVIHVQDLELDAAFDLGLVRSKWLRAVARKVERWLLNRFDVVSSISARMLDRLNDKGVPREKLLLFPNWIDTADIKPGSEVSSYRQEWGIAPDTVVALYSGSLGEKQGVEALLEAARQLGDSVDIRFVVCSDGPAFRRLKLAYAACPNITWRELVPAERLNDLLNLADIHLLPQRADAADLVMPSKLTGMLASGRPVVATALPGTQVAEVVEGRGLVVPPGDVNALVQAIRDLASDARLRESLGAAGREYALEHLDRNAILSRFETQLRDLLVRRG
jgi:colanic acid biosynthesis glycosyl transferase WcaI